MTKKPLQRKRQPNQKIIGHRGQWTADVGKDELAVLHRTWWQPPAAYHDPMNGVDLAGEKYRRLTEALRNNNVAVMQRDAGDQIMSRDGYIGLFSYKDLAIGDDGSITLTLVDRLQ